MTDRILLQGIVAGLALVAVVCVVGLIRAASVVEAFFLLAILVASVHGIRESRRFL